jgi:hypothetical protein
VHGRAVVVHGQHTEHACELLGARAPARIASRLPVTVPARRHRDINELVGTLDRKLRLAPRIAAERGWSSGPAVKVSGWLIVAPTRTNRRRIRAHATMLRSFLPLDGRSVHGWLDDPSGALRCLSFWPDPHGQTAGTVGRSVRRVAKPRAAIRERAVPRAARGDRIGGGETVSGR